MTIDLQKYGSAHVFAIVVFFLSLSLTCAWSTWPLQLVRVHQKEMILKHWIKMVVERVLCRICACCAHVLSFRCR